MVFWSNQRQIQMTWNLKCNANTMKLKLFSFLFLGGGFCPTGSWRRSPRKGRGCLQIPPPTKREERLAPPFWPQCSWTRPKVKRWNCPTWRMSVFSPQPWCTFCICKASYNLWSLWSLWVLPYSMIQIFCHISWKSSFHFCPFQMGIHRRD